MRMTSMFSQMAVFVVYMKTINGIVFKTMHFETHFQKFAYSGPQNIVAI